MEHGNGVLDELVDGFVRAALDVLLDQFLEFGPKADFHSDILPQHQELHRSSQQQLGSATGQ